MVMVKSRNVAENVISFRWADFSVSRFRKPPVDVQCMRNASTEWLSLLVEKVLLKTSPFVCLFVMYNTNV